MYKNLKNSGILSLVVIGILLVLSMNVDSYYVQMSEAGGGPTGTCYCYNCSDCENALNDNCNEIKIGTDIDGIDCLRIEVNQTNKTINCQGNIITGGGNGIVNLGNGTTIKNCIIKNKIYGIQSIGENSNIANNTIINSSTAIFFSQDEVMEWIDPESLTWCEPYGNFIYDRQYRMKINQTVEDNINFQVHIPSNVIPNLNMNSFVVTTTGNNGNCICNNFLSTAIQDADENIIINIQNMKSGTNYYIYFGNKSVENNSLDKVCYNPESPSQPINTKMEESKVPLQYFTDSATKNEQSAYFCDDTNSILFMNISSLNDLMAINNITGKKVGIIKWQTKQMYDINLGGGYNIYCALLDIKEAGYYNITFKKKPDDYTETNCMLFNWSFTSNGGEINGNSGEINGTNGIYDFYDYFYFEDNYQYFNLYVKDCLLFRKDEMVFYPSDTYFSPTDNLKINNSNYESYERYLNSHPNFEVRNNSKTIIFFSEVNVIINQSNFTHISIKNNSIWLNYTNESVCDLGVTINYSSGKVLIYNQNINQSIFLLHEVNIYNQVHNGYNISCQNGELKLIPISWDQNEQIDEQRLHLPSPNYCGGFYYTTLESGLSLQERIDRAEVYATYHQCWLEIQPPAIVLPPIFNWNNSLNNTNETGSMIKNLVNDLNLNWIDNMTSMNITKIDEHTSQVIIHNNDGTTTTLIIVKDDNTNQITITNQNTNEAIKENLNVLKMTAEYYNNNGVNTKNKTYDTKTLKDGTIGIYEEPAPYNPPRKKVNQQFETGVNLHTDAQKIISSPAFYILIVKNDYEASVNNVNITFTTENPQMICEIFNISGNDTHNLKCNWLGTYEVGTNISGTLRFTYGGTYDEQNFMLIFESQNITSEMDGNNINNNIKGIYINGIGGIKLNGNNITNNQYGIYNTYGSFNFYNNILCPNFLYSIYNYNNFGLSYGSHNYCNNIDIANGCDYKCKLKDDCKQCNYNSECDGGYCVKVHKGNVCWNEPKGVFCIDAAPLNTYKPPEINFTLTENQKEMDIPGMFKDLYGNSLGLIISFLLFPFFLGIWFKTRSIIYLAMTVLILFFLLGDFLLMGSVDVVQKIVVVAIVMILFYVFWKAA